MRTGKDEILRTNFICVRQCLCQHFLASAHEMKAAYNSQDLLLWKLFLDCFEDIDVPRVGTPENDHKPLRSLGHEGGVVDDGARACAVFIKELALGRGVAARFARDVREEIQVLIKFSYVIDRFEPGYSILRPDRAFPGFLLVLPS